MRTGSDISNLQGPPSQYRNTDWYRNSEFILIQGIQPPYPYLGWNHTDAVTGLKGYTGEQMTAAREDGKKVGVYAFLWNGLANVQADILARLNCTPKGFPLDMRPYVDVEDVTKMAVTTRRTSVTNARAAADYWASLNALPQSGGYTGTWYVSGYLAGWWPDWPSWWADYSSPAGSILSPARVIHQYTSSPIDSDAALDQEIITRSVNMAIKPAEGMAAQMAAKGDTPLFGHSFHDETDDDGKTYTVEQCWGTQGMYVSSNSSGSWINAGPL